MQTQAMIVGIKIARLEKLKCLTIPLLPGNFRESGLKPVRTVYDQEGKPLWFHVNRIDYINWLKRTNMIFKKREVNVRDCLRKS